MSQPSVSHHLHPVFELSYMSFEDGMEAPVLTVKELNDRKRWVITPRTRMLILASKYPDDDAHNWLSSEYSGLKPLTKAMSLADRCRYESFGKRKTAMGVSASGRRPLPEPG